MKPARKILVIRFSSIGDIVQATSPLRAIRKKYPNYEITFLTLDTFSSILEFHPDIDRLVSLPRSMGIFRLLEFGTYLDRKNFDIIFDLHNSLRSNLLLLRTKSSLQRLKKPRLKRFFLFYFHYNTFQHSFNVRKMYLDHLGFNDRIGDITIPKTKLVLSNHEIGYAKKKLLSLGIIDDYFVIIPGAAWSQKQWSKNKYGKLIRKLKIPCVLVGSEKDKICFEIARFSKNTFNMAGKTSLREAMAIIYNANYVIGSDTGLMHAAEALGKPVTMIMGPTSTETGGGSYLDLSTSVAKDIWCRPCSQNGSTPCYRDKQYCMETIDVDDVLQALVKH